MRRLAITATLAAALVLAHGGTPHAGTDAAANGDAALVAQLTALLLDGQDVDGAVPATFIRQDAAVYVALRRNGRKLAAAWGARGLGLDSLRGAISRAKKRLDDGARPDTVELVIAHGFRPVRYERFKRTFGNLNRGVDGIELRYGDKMLRYGPSQTIATNRSFPKLLERFAEKHGLSEDDLAGGLSVERFKAEQFLVALAGAPSATRMRRGNRMVGLAEVTREGVEGLARRMANWMIRNVDADGRMTYKYWPSRGQEASSNNMIRQWMASVCLVRLGDFYDDAEITALAERNMRYNLARFYREQDGLGLIEFRDKVKLGAVALAALAIAEHPNRQAFAAEEAALRRTIDHLWQDDGGFRTFFKPTKRNDNQNFYPGEALLYLATVYRRSGEAELLARIQKSARAYKSWHLTYRNPAFVPWHSMAYAEVWQETGEDWLRDWIFEMNDWLLSVQQGGTDTYPEIDGRFYDPKRRHFGPPHASSTGVYLEGLIQAYRVARKSDDERRAEAYRAAILRGIRHLMQLEFRDEVDMFYISRRDRVQGGLRTTIYNNEIRVDNVQHGLMALLEILKAFEDEDFAG